MAKLEDVPNEFIRTEIEEFVERDDERARMIDMFSACSRRTYSDVAIAWKPSKPENMSISEIAMRCGWLSCSPLFSVTIPVNACSTGSMAGRAASGPVWPKPEIE